MTTGNQVSELKLENGNVQPDNIHRFEVGNIYQMTFIGDSDLKVPFICVKRTAKMVTLEKFQGKEVLKRRVKVYGRSEYVTEGNYSMAPSINANKVIG